MAEDVPAGRYDDLVEEGGIPLAGMRYVRFLGPDGESCFRWEFDGKQSLSMTVGDLHRIVAALISDDEVEDVDGSG